jgi:hypothetical protein
MSYELDLVEHWDGRRDLGQQGRSDERVDGALGLDGWVKGGYSLRVVYLVPEIFSSLSPHPFETSAMSKSKLSGKLVVPLGATMTAVVVAVAAGHVPSPASCALALAIALSASLARFAMMPVAAARATTAAARRPKATERIRTDGFRGPGP